MLTESNCKLRSENIKINDELRQYRKINDFNDTSEKIIFVEQKNNLLIGITQIIKCSESCLIQSIDFNIYNFINGDFTSEYSIGKSHCEIIGKYKNKLKIFDLGIESANQNSGYGSLLLTQIIKSAKELKCEYIVGDVYDKDVETLDLNKRLHHFYEKFGFEVDDGKIKLRLLC